MSDCHETTAKPSCSRTQHHNNRRILSRLFSSCFLLAWIAWPLIHLRAEEPFAGLQWGEYEVGFRSSIQLDHTRSYSTAYDSGKTYGGTSGMPRPILINLWYPASGDSQNQTDHVISHGDYLQLSPDIEMLQTWAGSLSKYNRDIVATEFFGKPVAELDSLESKLWKRFLALPTRALRNASPAGGKFPVIVYHSGAGSSFEDNSVLCEYLASCGFVVVGSAFQKGDGSSLGIDSRQDSVRDIGILCQFASDLPFANWNRIAVAGHSLGAQTCVRATTQPSCPADAVVLLDTTVDYYSLKIPTYNYITSLAIENRKHIDQPMLVVAGPGAMFQMCDQLHRSDRDYLTIPELDHNEFISQGILRLHVLAWLNEERPSEEYRESLNRAGMLNGYYVTLCHSIVAWLNGRLNDQSGDFQVLADEYSRHAASNAGIGLQSVVAGTTGADPYSETDPAPPLPRQLSPLLNRIGAERFCEILKQRQGRHADHPVYKSSMIYGSLLHDLVVEQRIEEARVLGRYGKEIGCDGMSTLRFLALMSRLTHKPDQARYYLETVLAIDPDDSLARESLEELRATEDGESQSVPDR